MDKVSSSEVAGWSFAIDDGDQNYKDQRDYAQRIAKLLDLPAVAQNLEVAACLDDFLGAVHALIIARRLGFKDRTSAPNMEAVRKRAASLAKGKIKLDGRWVAGFYFNNALFRLAAVQDRIWRVLTRKRSKPIPDLSGTKLQLVREEVNGLKHEPRGVHKARTVTFTDGLEAARELLQLIEWGEQNSKY